MQSIETYVLISLASNQINGVNYDEERLKAQEWKRCLDATLINLPRISEVKDEAG